MEELKYQESIGGYFELELPLLPGFRKGELLFNSGRSALSFLLQQLNIRKVYLPRYTCDVVLEPIKKLGIEYSFYSINDQLLPKESFEKIEKKTAIVVNNYFGLLDAKIQNLPFIKNVIVDNSQAFYSNTIGGYGGFNSFRKFFGLADGAQVLQQSDKLNIDKYESNSRFFSCDKMIHLLGRIESGAEKYYQEYNENDRKLVFSKIQKISNISKKIYNSLDHKSIAKTRKTNFEFLHNNLYKNNKLELNNFDKAVPLVYPFWINNGSELRSYLISKRIYVAKFWPNKEIKLLPNSLEIDLMRNLVALPIDQRYGIKEMKIILNHISRYVK